VVVIVKDNLVVRKGKIYIYLFLIGAIFYLDKDDDDYTQKIEMKEIR